MLSGNKDVDREILSNLDDEELLKACSIDKYTWNNVCDDGFLKRRILVKYPDIEQYKKPEESWKKFFLRATYFISLMKENYGYIYKSGDFAGQHFILSFGEDKNKLLLTATRFGEFELVKWSIENGANDLNEALVLASMEGKLEILKYLIERGANIHHKNDLALLMAETNNHTAIVSYLSKMKN